MGEVYRALDPKLKRHVAIKVLPETFSRDADRIARFRREAQLLAALNHPNIAAIYGLEEAGDTTALVMEEVVQGDTLSGPLAVETALNYAKQIAEALEAAHEKGIVHRDLKPANIKVTPAGVVKVLDFGLATIIQPGNESANSEDPQNSPTLTRTLGTQSGVIMGTAAYMSPEQAAGKPVDKRADIWSFGVVLFEMLTGRQLFDGGETISHTLADVLRAPIDFSRLPSATPPAIRDLLRRCLDRDVKNRLRDIGEARIAVENAGKPVEQLLSEPAARQSRSTLWIALAAILVAGFAGAGWWRASRPGERPPLMRFADDVGDEINTDSSIGPAIAISPDGLRLAFISRTNDGKSHLSVRSIGGSQSTVLAGADGEGGPFAPFFSPNGRSIGFFTNTKLRTISVEGGAAATVCDLGAAPRGGFWGDDGSILFATQRTPVMRVPALGGTPTPATELDSKQGEATNRFGQLLPGRKAILFSASKDNNVWENATIQVQTLADGKRKTLITDGHFGRYLAAGPGNGHLLYVRNGTIFAAPMDLNRLELTGPSMPILEDVATRGQNGFSQFDVSASGTMVYVAGSNRREARSLAFVDASGKVQLLPAPPAAYRGVAEPSPDGTRILIGIEEGPSLNLSVYELATNRTTRLTFLKGAPAGAANRGIWTPDGKHIVFSIVAHELAGPGVYWTRADGAGEPHRLLENVYQPGSFYARRQAVRLLNGSSSTGPVRSVGL
jgi:serine/threonine-protein kinase